MNNRGIYNIIDKEIEKLLIEIILIITLVFASGMFLLDNNQLHNASVANYYSTNN